MYRKLFKTIIKITVAFMRVEKVIYAKQPETDVYNEVRLKRRGYNILRSTITEQISSYHFSPAIMPGRGEISMWLILEYISGTSIISP